MLPEFKEIIWKETLKSTVRDFNGVILHYKCRFCNKKIKRQDFFKIHMHRQHHAPLGIERPPKEHKCQQCQFEFYSRGELSSHVRNKHTKRTSNAPQVKENKYTASYDFAEFPLSEFEPLYTDNDQTISTMLPQSSETAPEFASESNGLPNESVCFPNEIVGNELLEQSDPASLSAEVPNLFCADTHCQEIDVSSYCIATEDDESEVTSSTDCNEMKTDVSEDVS